MRTIAATFVVIGLMASPLAADPRGSRHGRSQGIPPGHLPPEGACRVWYEGRPPGQQPPPTSCRDAERIAARSRDARVIYGSERGRRDDGWWARDGDRRDRPRAIPRRDRSGDPDYDRYPYPSSRYPDRGRYPGDTRYGYGSVAFDNGYKDGYDKGREDARDNDDYDPVRHGRYRSADRGYNSRYGSKTEYKNVYRDGFRAGYDEAYREWDRYDRDRDNRGSWWPF